jgi:hypothetical protein
MQPEAVRQGYEPTPFFFVQTSEAAGSRVVAWDFCGCHQPPGLGNPPASGFSIDAGPLCVDPRPRRSTWR